ncbi:hypothetical protein BpHYR1_050499 [Brachionus plicatilis]|uniref:Uncharacterized protein n=1 Tax=Brachionus plicatilis TaxID=10195 RepID=A0A3M7SB39_BRAPC|nr:hypothetical protein BpHYR1_050499 [Brachionus plicatilis]
MFISASRSVYLLRYVTIVLILSYHCASFEKLMIKMQAVNRTGGESETEELTVKFSFKKDDHNRYFPYIKIS